MTKRFRSMSELAPESVEPYACLSMSSVSVMNMGNHSSSRYDTEDVFT